MLHEVSPLRSKRKWRDAAHSASQPSVHPSPSLDHYRTPNEKVSITHELVQGVVRELEHVRTTTLGIPASESTSDSKGADLQRVRHILRELKKNGVNKTDLYAQTALTPDIVRAAKRAQLKEGLHTATAIVTSEAAASIAGWSAQMSDLQDHMPVRNPLTLAGLAVGSYAVLLASLRVNEKANAALLRETRIGTDPFSKIGDAAGKGKEKKRTFAKVGYWVWHSSMELYYMGVTGALVAKEAAKSDNGFGDVDAWRNGLAFFIPSNIVGAAKLFGQAALTEASIWWIKGGRDKWAQSSTKATIDRVQSKLLRKKIE